MTWSTPGVARRELLRGAGLLAAGGATAALLGACGSDDESPAGGSTGATLKPVKLGWWGATCEAPLFTAYHKGFFAREGLQVELVNLGEAAAKDAIASGKVDGAPGITFEWLKPIEQGADIRVTGGLHGGCLRLVVGAKSGITSLAQLKGKTIGTDRIGGSAHSFFTVVLADAGLDPRKDIQFVAFPGAQLGTALDKGEIVAAAAADPHPYLIASSGKGVELASNLTGTYKDHFCCAIGLNGKLVRDEPETAAAVTRGWISAARWIGSNTAEVGKLEVDNKYVPVDADVAAKLLSTYYWIGSVERLQANIDRYAEEFAKTDILEKSTDPKELAATVFADVTGGDKGIDDSTPGGAPSAATPSATDASSAAALPSASGSAQAVGGLIDPEVYRLTAAQRRQLEEYANHHARLHAGRVA